MISFHWRWTLIFGAFFILGLIIGIAWHIPFDQATNLVFLMAGLLAGMIAVFATLWVTARERELRLTEIRSAIGDTKEAVAALREQAILAAQPSKLAHPDRQPLGAASAVTESVRHAAEGIVDDLDETLGQHVTAIVREAGVRGGALTPEDLARMKSGLKEDIEEFVRSLASETQLMMRVAQLTSIGPVERFLMKDLVGGATPSAEWGASHDSRKSPFPLGNIRTARDRLIAIGLVQTQTAGRQIVAQLPPGWVDAVEQYEQMYGAIEIGVRDPAQAAMDQVKGVALRVMDSDLEKSARPNGATG